ncbi:hypothetical protein DP153_05895 [Clostridium tetani]|nr:hypothetical protein DP150_06545 [Clostridium tetani]RXM88695.1 hypothetical protein DP153_05895 [Clostridium tetani]
MFKLNKPKRPQFKAPIKTKMKEILSIKLNLYIILPPVCFNTILSHMTSNPNSIAQYAALEALTGEQESINSMVSEFEKRRNYMVERINSINGIECIEPKGAFYMFADINKVIGKKINGEEIKNSVDFCEKLLELYKVAVVPGAAFGLENHIRLSYAISMENIEKGLDRISNCVSELQS